jgi:transcription antitermination protein NusB
VASARHLGREVALQVLCALEASPELDPPAAFGLYLAHLAGGEEEDTPLPAARDFDREFAELLVRLASEHRDELDRAITQVSRTWRIDRMARVDRNILRLAVAELQHLPEIPVRVIINEAVELAKRYGTTESPAFINGLLDSLAKTMPGRK